ncbi:globin domain-containing protein [Streptomyces sp. NPDC005322]|uniref:globin domain-containing protein n=1 Tax=unclassified Streptomyces TaxID=2593676 RepID=UPI0033B3DC32
MDAPTTTSSAGNDGSGGNSGDWGWFTPSRKPAEDQTRAPDREDEQRVPNRPVSPIRPVGSGAERRTQSSESIRPPEPVRPAGPARHVGSVPPPAPGPASTGRETAPGAREEHQRPDEAPAPQDVRPGFDAAFAAPEAASPDAILLRRTMAEIEPVSDKVTSYFYALLFVQHPELRPLFPAAMDAQRDRLFKAMLTAARLIDDRDILTDFLSRLGRGHRKYGTQPEHYPAVGECLIGALTRYAVNSWSDETEAAWVRAYTQMSQVMIDSAAEDELRAPAWWQAEVVGHELRTSDIAVVTVRPDQPYPFLAGQYTSLETPWWPRVWRHYSFASAPRPDGLLSFHVKAVPAGWVSSALVHRARPGDVIRLGPPAGSMTVDHSSDNGLLCLGGGTGIAPIKALVEDVAERGRQRTVEVFYGARSDHDLYDIDTMLRLAQKHPWLSVRPVVSDGPTNGLSGRLPDAVRQYGPWNAFDAYLSGPPGLIRSGVDTLMGIGIPSHRIRHDSIEELAAAAE